MSVYICKLCQHFSSQHTLREGGDLKAGPYDCACGCSISQDSPTEVMSNADWNRLTDEQESQYRPRVRLIRLTVDDLRVELRVFEERYGLPSDRLAEAFTVDGQLDESEDFQDWSLAYAAFNAAQALS